MGHYSLKTRTFKNSAYLKTIYLASFLGHHSYIDSEAEFSHKRQQNEGTYGYFVPESIQKNICVQKASTISSATGEEYESRFPIRQKLWCHGIFGLILIQARFAVSFNFLNPLIDWRVEGFVLCPGSPFPRLLFSFLNLLTNSGVKDCSLIQGGPPLVLILWLRLHIPKPPDRSVSGRISSSFCLLYLSNEGLPAHCVD